MSGPGVALGRRQKPCGSPTSRTLQTVSTIFGVGLRGSKPYDRQARRDYTTGNSSMWSSVAMISKHHDERRRSNLAVASVTPCGEVDEKREACPSSFSRQSTLVVHDPLTMSDPSRPRRTIKTILAHRRGYWLRTWIRAVANRCSSFHVSDFSGWYSRYSRL